MINVEIQKSGYRFQGERASCYSSDLLMRELTDKRNLLGEKFKYSDMKKVYTIILIEESDARYKEHKNSFIHRGKVRFDTGLNLEMLQEYIIIPLDVFKKMNHNELNELEAWLYFMSSDQPADIMKVVEAYPDEFKPIYGELAALRFKTRELIEMYDVYREALRVADENTARYMVEEQQQQIKQQGLQIELLKQEKEQERKEKEQLIQEKEEYKRRLAKYEQVD